MRTALLRGLVVGIAVGVLAAVFRGTKYGWTKDVWEFAALWGGVYFVSQTVWVLVADRRRKPRMPSGR
jgi:hypothetical protein